MKKTRKQKKAEYQKTYRERYPEKVKASNKAYYDANKDALAQKRREHREGSPAQENRQKDILREHRRSLGMSQQKYSEKLGVTQATLSNWERGIAPVNIDTVDAAFPGMGKKLRKGKVI